MSPLFAKLRYRLGMRVCVVGAPSGFAAELARLPKSIERVATLRGRFDLVQAFVTRKAELTTLAPRICTALGPDGIVWIAYPKGRALGTDLTRDVIHEIAPAWGLRTVAQVAIDEVWSAMRCKLA